MVWARPGTVRARWKGSRPNAQLNREVGKRTRVSPPLFAPSRKLFYHSADSPWGILAQMPAQTRPTRRRADPRSPVAGTTPTSTADHVAPSRWVDTIVPHSFAMRSNASYAGQAPSPAVELERVGAPRQRPRGRAARADALSRIRGLSYVYPMVLGARRATFTHISPVPDVGGFPYPAAAHQVLP
jgi:hypothetical protein